MNPRMLKLLGMSVLLALPVGVWLFWDLLFPPSGNPQGYQAPVPAAQGNAPAQGPSPAPAQGAGTGSAPQGTGDAASQTLRSSVDPLRNPFRDDIQRHQERQSEDRQHLQEMQQALDQSRAQNGVLQRQLQQARQQAEDQQRQNADLAAHVQELEDQIAEIEVEMRNNRTEQGPVAPTGPRAAFVVRGVIVGEAAASRAVIEVTLGEDVTGWLVAQAGDTLPGGYLVREVTADGALIEDVTGMQQLYPTVHWSPPNPDEEEDPRQGGQRPRTQRPVPPRTSGAGGRRM